MYFSFSQADLLQSDPANIRILPAGYPNTVSGRQSISAHPYSCCIFTDVLLNAVHWKVRVWEAVYGTDHPHKATNDPVMVRAASDNQTAVSGLSDQPPTSLRGGQNNS